MSVTIEVRTITKDIQEIQTSFFSTYQKQTITKQDVFTICGKKCELVVKNPFNNNHYFAICVCDDGQCTSNRLCQSLQEFCVEMKNVPFTSYPQPMTLQTSYFYSELIKSFMAMGVEYERIDVNESCPSFFKVLLYEKKENESMALVYLLRYIVQHVSYHLGYRMCENNIDTFGNHLATHHYY